MAERKRERKGMHKWIYPTCVSFFDMLHKIHNGGGGTGGLLLLMLVVFSVSWATCSQTHTHTMSPLNKQIQSRLIPAHTHTSLQIFWMLPSCGHLALALLLEHQPSFALWLIRLIVSFSLPSSFFNSKSNFFQRMFADFVFLIFFCLSSSLPLC